MCRGEKNRSEEEIIIQNRKFRNVENDIRIFFPLEIPLVLLEHLKLLSEDLLTSFSSIIFFVFLGFLPFHEN